MTVSNRQALIEHLKVNYKQGQDWKEIEDIFGIKSNAARSIWLRYRKKHNNFSIPSEKQKQKSTTPKVVGFTEDIKTGTAETTIRASEEIRDLEELKNIIDTTKWDIVKYVQNYWGNAGNPHWQVKAWLEPKKVKESEVILRFLKDYKSTWAPIPQKDLQLNPMWELRSMLLINLNDLHFDKQDMDDNTIDQRIKDYDAVLRDLALRAYRSACIEEVTFVIGNDMFNTDNFLNSTTNGTPQRINTTWDVAYEKVFGAMIKSISFLKGLCTKLNVILVPGNHDRTKSYYMAHALEVYFRTDASIVFNRDSSLKKKIVFGEQFIGFNHGNNVNDKLPLAFATEFYEDWGKCKYHDIVISDKHHNNEKIFRSNQTQNEFQGVKLRILPSLSGTDQWHSDNLYHSRQSGIALLYDKQRGKTAEFEYNL